MRQVISILIVAFIIVSCKNQKQTIQSQPYNQKFNFAEIVGCLDKPADFAEPDTWARYHLGTDGLNLDIARAKAKLNIVGSNTIQATVSLYF